MALQSRSLVCYNKSTKLTFFSNNFLTGMDITCLHTSFYRTLFVRPGERCPVIRTLFGVDTDLRYYVIRDVIVL